MVAMSGSAKVCVPGLVLRDELLEVRAPGRAESWTGAGDRLLHGRLGVVVGLQEARVGGGLVAAQAGLLVDDELLDRVARAIRWSDCSIRPTVVLAP